MKKPKIIDAEFVVISEAPAPEPSVWQKYGVLLTIVFCLAMAAIRAIGN